MAGAGACIDDSDYVDAARRQGEAIVNDATTESLINAALALWQRNSSKSIAGMKNEIADRQLKLAEAIHEHAKKFWPYAKALVDDAFAETKAEPQHSALSSQFGGLVDVALRAARDDWRKTVVSMCLAPTACETARWNRVAQNVRADAMSFGDRQAEARADIINDRRYARQYSALALGKGILADVATFQSLAGNVGVSAAQILTDSINTGLSALGYANNRSGADGWGAAARDNKARAPYSAKQSSADVRVTPIVQPDLKSFDLPAKDPCGPMPDMGTQAYLDWNECKGYK